MKTATMIVLLLPVVALLIWLVPIGLIWAVNTLFLTGIPFTLKTWCAAFLLAGLVAANR